jgi:hypothetical protein
MKLGLFNKLLTTAEQLKESLPKKIFQEKANLLIQDANKAITYVIDDAGNLKSELHNITLEELTNVSLSGIAKVLEQIRQSPDEHQKVVDKVINLVLPHYYNERDSMLEEIKTLKSDIDASKVEILQLKNSLSALQDASVIDTVPKDQPQIIDSQS